MSYWLNVTGALAICERIFSTVFMIAVVVLVFVAALTRYMGAPINWSVDLAQGLFVWVVYLGASTAMRESRHIGVNVFVDMLPPHLKKAIEVFGNLLVIVFLGCVAYYGVQVSIKNVNRELVSIPISYSFVTIAASVGSILMSLTLIERTISLLRSPTVKTET